ncbi:hypothetical protein ACET6U_04355 [Aeromonas rivipollensis]
MSNNPKTPVEQIQKLADDVRLIQEFSANCGFGENLLLVNIAPDKKQKSKWSWPLFTMICGVILMIAMLGALKFVTLEKATTDFMFLLGVLFGTMVVVSTHIKFNNTAVTIIMTIGMFMLLFVGTGILTPKEAMDNIKDLKK